MTIKTKLLLSILIPLIIVLMILDSIFYNYVSTEIEQKADQVLLSKTKEIKLENSSKIKEISSILNTLLFSRDIDEYFMYSNLGLMDSAEDSRWKVENDFYKCARMKPGFAELALLNLDGSSVVSIINRKINYNKDKFLDKKRLEKAKTLKKNHSYIFLSTDNNKKNATLINVIVPYYDRLDTLRGFGLVSMNMDNFYSELAKTLAKENYELDCVKDNGKILFSFDRNKIGLNISEFESFKNGINGKKDVITEKDYLGNQSMKKAFIPCIFENNIFILTLPHSEIIAFGKQLGTFNLILFIITILVLSIIIYINANKFSEPILDLRNFALEIAKGNLEKEIEVTSKDEIGELGNAFNNMAAELKKRNDALENEILERKKTNEELISANQQKSKFLSTMSHELRTPLNAIIGFSEILNQKMFGNLNEKQNEYVQLINRSGNHLLLLINDILDIVKIETDTINILKEEFTLKDSIEEILSLMETDFIEKELKVTFNFDETIDKIYYDKRRLKQILFNLLSNAQKFTPNGKQIEVKCEKIDSETIKISVIDEGYGIDENDLERIFDEFYRTPSMVQKAIRGTGIGLALTKSLVELHEGEIGVISKLDEGSTFWFTVKLNPANKKVLICI